MQKHRDDQIKIKREKVEEDSRRRKIARPRASDTQLELDGDGNFREGSASNLAVAEPEVIELD